MFNNTTGTSLNKRYKKFNQVCTNGYDATTVKTQDKRLDQAK